MNRNVFQSVGILYRTYLNFANGFLKDLGLSFSESVIISHIGGSEGITQERIATSLCIDRAAIARTVKLLENKELIEIKKDAEDKRLKKLFLTPEGWEKFRAITAANADRLASLYDGLTPSEISTMEAVLSKLAEKAGSTDQQEENRFAKQ